MRGLRKRKNCQMKLKNTVFQKEIAELNRYINDLECQSEDDYSARPDGGDEED